MRSRSLMQRWMAWAVIAGLAGIVAGPSSAQPKFTDWGWPLPYEKVSDKSVHWLKSKGWSAGPGRVPGAVVGPEHDQHRDGPPAIAEGARDGRLTIERR